MIPQLDIPKNTITCANLTMAYMDKTGEELGGFLDEVFGACMQTEKFQKLDPNERYWFYTDKFKILHTFLNTVQP